MEGPDGNGESARAVHPCHERDLRGEDRDREDRPPRCARQPRVSKHRGIVRRSWCGRDRHCLGHQRRARRATQGQRPSGRFRATGAADDAERDHGRGPACQESLRGGTDHGVHHPGVHDGSVRQGGAGPRVRSRQGQVHHPARGERLRLSAIPPEQFKELNRIVERKFIRSRSAAQRACRGCGPRRPTAGVLVLLAIVVWLVGAPITGLVVGSITDTPPGTAPHFTFATLAYAYGDFEHLRSLASFARVRHDHCNAGAHHRRVSRVGRRRAPTRAVRDFVDLFALAPILIPSVRLRRGWILLLGPRTACVNLIADASISASRGRLFDMYSFCGNGLGRARCRRCRSRFSGCGRRSGR